VEVLGVLVQNIEKVVRLNFIELLEPSDMGAGLIPTFRLVDHLLKMHNLSIKLRFFKFAVELLE